MVESVFPENGEIFGLRNRARIMGNFQINERFRRLSIIQMLFLMAARINNVLSLASRRESTGDNISG